MAHLRRRRSWLVAAIIPIAVFSAACNGTQAAPQAKVIFDKGTPLADLLVPKLTASVSDGAVGVTVDAPVTVSVADGVLASVTMVNENGKSITGQLSPDGLRWSTTEQLGYNRRYTLNAKATGLGGAASKQMTFETSSPAHLTMPYVNPADGDVVGIGEPVAIRFDENIANRAAAQKAINITTNPPVEGAFYWLNNREVRWRPERFWKSGTTIDVAVNTYGVDLGDGMFGEDNVKTHFTIGDEVISTADDTTKTVTVRVNGDVVKTMPTSMGKDSTPTANGVYIIGGRFKHIIMDSSTYGVPVNSAYGYRTTVELAVRFDDSGDFVHSAPWSVDDQGKRDVSHGCINISPANAQWFFNNFNAGDAIVVKNSSGGTYSRHDGSNDWQL